MKHFDAQAPLAQTCPAPQLVPSSAGAWPQLPDASHVSSVHGSPSSVHAEPLGLSVFAGQVVDEPSHFPPTSHAPDAARQAKFAEASMVPHVPSSSPVNALMQAWQ